MFAAHRNANAAPKGDMAGLLAMAARSGLTVASEDGEGGGEDQDDE